MNTVILLGRLTKDIELKKTGTGLSYCNFTLAVDRTYKDANGQRQADFISCVAWRSTAEFLAKYFHKGSKLLASGSIQTRSYDDANGQKRYVTEVLVDSVEFAESANQNQAPVVPQGYQQAPSAPTYYPTQPQQVAPVAPAAPVPQPMPENVELPFEI